MNLYEYGRSMPATSLDPKGLWKLRDFYSDKTKTTPFRTEAIPLIQVLGFRRIIVNKRYFRGSMQKTVILSCFLVSLVGCVSREQKETLNTWYEASKLVYDLQWEFGVMNIPSKSVLQRIGQPDRRVEARMLIKVLHPQWAESLLRDAIEDRHDMLLHLGKSVLNVEEEIMRSTFWFYEEGARWKYRAHPYSFWGMGTGFEVVWFIVSKEGWVLQARGIGLGKTRRTMVEE